GQMPAVDGPGGRDRRDRHHHQARQAGGPAGAGAAQRQAAVRGAEGHGPDHRRHRLAAGCRVEGAEGMKALLDTNALLWLSFAPEELGRRALSLIEKARQDAALSVSAVSFWEAALL